MTPPEHRAPVSANERIHALDALRAAAMFLGIVLHGTMSFTAALPLEGVSIDRGRHWGFDVVFTLIHGFRMHLFFLLAGFFARLARERLGLRNFIKQRLQRVGLPFVVSMVTILPLMGVAVWWQGRILNQRMILPPEFEGGFPTGHLWFLEYLLVLYGIALAIGWVGQFLPAGLFAKADLVFDRVMGSVWGAAPLAILTTPFLWNGPWWGEPRPAAFNIKVFPELIALYGGFFSVGWWIHRRRQCFEKLKSSVVTGFVFGLIALAVEEWLRTFVSGPNPRQLLFKTATLYCAGLYAWLMTFAAIGLFLRFASEPRSWVRYMADASYWCYLAHLPIVIFLQTMSARWAAPAVFKFLLIMAVTMAVLMVTYRFGVRYTWMGRMLNGPRTSHS